MCRSQLDGGSKRAMKVVCLRYDASTQSQPECKQTDRAVVFTL